MILLPEGLKALKKVAKKVGLALGGAYLNLDAGFDSTHNRKGSVAIWSCTCMLRINTPGLLANRHHGKTA